MGDVKGADCSGTSWCSKSSHSGLKASNSSIGFSWWFWICLCVPTDVTLATHPLPHISCSMIATCNQFPFWMLQLLPSLDRKHAQSCSEYGGGQCWDPYKASGLDRPVIGKIRKIFSRCICNHLSRAATWGIQLFDQLQGRTLTLMLRTISRDTHVGQHGMLKRLPGVIC